MIADAVEDRIADVRKFNRFFTRQIGVLREGLLHSPYSLTEARIIFEAANRDSLTASDLCRELGLDAGYLSRILARLEGQGVLTKVPSERDARQRLLRLTDQGQEAFALLDKRSRDEVSEMLADLSDDAQARLLKAMQTIEDIFNKGLKFSEPFFLRQHEPGDMGWVTHRHGVLYSQEYGWDERFEALVAQIVSDFIHQYNPEKERCWIAEMDGEIVGSVFLVEHSEYTAQLRLLLVEPKARGMGLGSRLVDECIRFARRVGYHKMMLWTNSVLLDARHIYAKKGFVMGETEHHYSFGQQLVGETWEMKL